MGKERLALSSAFLVEKSTGWVNHVTGTGLQPFTDSGTTCLTVSAAPSGKNQGELRSPRMLTKSSRPMADVCCSEASVLVRFAALVTLLVMTLRECSEDSQCPLLMWIRMLPARCFVAVFHPDGVPSRQETASPLNPSLSPGCNLTAPNPTSDS